MSHETKNASTEGQTVSRAAHIRGNSPVSTLVPERRSKLGKVLEVLRDSISKLHWESEGSNYESAGLKAAIGITLYKYVMKYSPRNSYYFNRDRLVSSGSYAGGWQSLFMHLVGTKDLTVDQTGRPSLLQKTTPPCHSTQAISNAVGLAIATKNLAALYNKSGFELLDNVIWCIIDDTNFQQDNALQTVALAGCWKLNNLCVIYDGSSSSGHLANQNAIGIPKLKGVGWNVIEVAGEDPSVTALCAAFSAARMSSQPTFVNIRSTNNSVSNERLHPPNYSNHFWLPQDVYDFFLDVRDNGDVYEADWMATVKAYGELYPALAEEFWLHVAGKKHDTSVKAAATESHPRNESIGFSGSMPAPLSPWPAAPQGSSRRRSQKGKRNFTKGDRPAQQQASRLTSGQAKLDTLYIRPCDAEEVAGAFLVAVKSTQISTIVSLPQQSLARYPEHSSRRGVTFGGYIFCDVDTECFDLTLISAGPEVYHAMGTRDFLFDEYRLKARVVSFPCMKLFQLQPEEYKQSVLKTQSRKPTVAIDAGNNKGWEPYADALISLEQVGNVPHQPAEIGPRVKSFVEEFKKQNRVG